MKPVFSSLLAALAISVASGSFCLADVASNGGKSNALRLVIPYNALGVGDTPFWLAIERGLFRRYGADVLAGAQMQSSTLVASMVSGETPFAIAGEDAAIGADLNGADIELIATGTNKLHFTVYASGRIRALRDLKGKAIGITQFGTTTDFIARYVLKKAGLQPGDATLIPLGSQANIYAALRAERIDAAVLGSEILALQPGMLGTLNPLMSMLDSDLLFYSDSLLAKRSWVKAHPDDTLNVVRGYAAGIAAIYTDKPAALAAIAKYAKTSDPGALEAGYRLLVKALPKVPLPETAALQTGLDESKLPAARTADPNRFIDPSFVARLEKDGFIDSLYRPQEAR